MLKKNIFASLYPVEKIQEPDVIEQPEKPRFSVPENIYTPVQVGDNPSENIGDQMAQAGRTEPTFANGSPMIQNAENVFTPQANAQPAPQAVPQNTQPIVNEPSFLDRSRLDYETAQNKLKNVKNEDKGWKGGLLEGIQNFLYSMGEARRMNPRANWKEVLAGGAIGTGLGFVDRTWNERRKYEKEANDALGKYQVAAKQAQIDSDLKTAETNRQDKKDDNMRLENQFNIREQNRFLLEQRRFENRMKQLDKKAEMDGRKWKRRVDENGKVWVDFQNGKSEPFMNPENPSEQDIDPSYKLYEVYSPMTNTKVQIKGAELYRGESQTNAANTTITNAGLSDQQTYDGKKAKLSGDISASEAKISSLQADLSKLENAQYDDEIKKRDSIEKELRDERAKLQGLKTELGNLPKPPQRKTINAPKVSRERDPLGLFQ